MLSRYFEPGLPHQAGVAEQVRVRHGLMSRRSTGACRRSRGRADRQDLDEPLVRTTRKLVEERLRALAGSHLIPLGDDHQRRNLDPLGVVVWLAHVPVIAVVLEYASRAAQHWRL